METWNKLKQPPKSALKEITGGRLKGMTDVNPQWRYQAMTEAFGACGVGWKYEIKRLWCEPAQNEIFAFAEVNVYVKGADGWGEPIPGVGGSKLIAKETAGLHSNDEGYKMAVTDALSVALKMLGVASDIYMGLWDGSKYTETRTDEEPKLIDEKQLSSLVDYMDKLNVDEAKFKAFMGVTSLAEITTDNYPKAIAAMKAKEKKSAAA